MRAKSRRRRGRRSRRARLLLAVGAALLIGGAAHLVASLPSTERLQALAREPVRDSAVMRARRAQAAERGRRLRVTQRWVELPAISPHLRAAVVASEDARFFAHSGLDFTEIKEAVRGRIEEGRKLRGASTLTQQLARNLYLSEERSLGRKLKEALVAWRLERVLSKQRILTLYLNVAEWGEGVFGAEAAARVHFGKRASELSLAEAAALAAMLPNPHRINPDHPATLRRRALHVLARVEAERLAPRRQVAEARAEIESWLGGRAQATN
jgi:monofunctional biosynthetic peptidoglycan transglycosylase